MPVRIDLSHLRDIRDFRLDTRGDLEIHALGGDDYVIGSKFDDVIYGDAGDDALFGWDGDDRVYGGDGLDYIQGGRGNDELVGGNGYDFLYGQDGDDRLWGGAGGDKLHGGDGNDQIIGGTGDDGADGGAGDDWIWGGSQDDEGLFGGSGNDRIWGEDGRDFLFGEDGSDQLYGGADSDVLGGGRGVDRLEGGAGPDSFVFTSGDVATSTVSFFGHTFTYETFETDAIADFAVAGGDLLDVRNLLDGKTSFAGTAAAQAVGQGYIYWVQQGQPGQADFGTTVYVDRDGGLHNPNGMFGAGDFAIAHLEGVPANQLDATHFNV